jgi:DHA3 family macrolide efflux protein-like MFS transporter
MEQKHTLQNQTTFRNYLFFWSGQLVSLLGSSIVQFVIVWWITVETGSAMYLSLATFLSLAPMIIVGPFAGVFADRWNRKLLILVADLMQALTVLVLVVFYWIGNVVIWQVLLMLAIRGIFQAFHEPTVSAITPSMVPKDKLSRLNGLNYLFSGAVRLVGPILAAVLLQVWQMHQILWLDVVTFLIAIVPLVMIKIPIVRISEAGKSFRNELYEGFSFIRHARGMLTLTIIAASLNFLIMPFSTLLPYFVKFDHLGGPSELALVMALLQGGILGGGLIMSLKKDFKKKVATTIASIAVAFCGYALIALTPRGSFWFMALGALIFALCIPIANVLIQTIMQIVVPLDMQGRVGSVTTALSMAAQPIGTLMSGAIVQFTPTAYLFLSCSLLGIVVSASSWFFTDVRHLEDLPHVSETAVARATVDFKE